jgi:hypothetical protein
VTRADVQSALGRSLGAGNEENITNQSTCEYRSPRGQVTVTIQHLSTDPDLPTEIAALQREIEGSVARPAPALGPRAFFLDINGAGTQLHVLHGRDYLLVSILGFGEGGTISAAAEKLAQSAIARM